MLKTRGDETIVSALIAKREQGMRLRTMVLVMTMIATERSALCLRVCLCLTAYVGL